ncbi:hypothetical protein CF15_03720 [Pyrodictium occultum]|uniref:Uncharacterized protein n=1 Tax=Pyrodictium occultum TaxID=2309 RepID=A0A0V8RV32_PYROC|nr:hypothetical protein CF15_03720 [Pyrodictium occultum]
MVDEILRRPDPSGRYVIVVRRTSTSWEELKKLLKGYGLEVEEAGDVVILRTRSRRIAREVALQALKMGILDSG